MSGEDGAMVISEHLTRLELSLSDPFAPEDSDECAFREAWSELSDVERALVREWRDKLGRETMLSQQFALAKLERLMRVRGWSLCGKRAIDMYKDAEEEAGQEEAQEAVGGEAGERDMGMSEEEAVAGNSLSIRELIRQVQLELTESQRERQARGEAALFKVEKMDLEVNFVVSRSTEGTGGFSFQVLTLGGVNVGGGKTYQQQQVHRITLSLKVASQKGEEEYGGTTTPEGALPAPAPPDR